MAPLFTTIEGTLFLKLLAAHLLTDFFLQPDAWVSQKKDLGWKAPALWWHGLLTGIVAFAVLLPQVHPWYALIIAGTHTLIDGLKLSYDKNRNPSAQFILFIADQALHLVVLGIVWLGIIHKTAYIFTMLQLLTSYNTLLMLVGYMLVTAPAGYIIGIFTSRWARELNHSDSLKDVGKWIGILERTIILTLIFLHQFAAIGFLITAKSLLRVIDKPDRPATEPGFTPPFSSRKHTEYVLIGTFLSFAIALATGIVIDKLMAL